MPMTFACNCLVVLGPTASGKTALACDIAYKLDGEVISADSRQVYRKLDIGTGKDFGSYLVNGKKIRYHLIDIADAGTQFYLHEFAAGLERAFSDITSRKKLPVICGGTGLYLDALQRRFDLTEVPENPELRLSLEALDKRELLARLLRYPAKNVAHVDQTSVKRIIRGIEVAEFLSGKKLVDAPPVPYRPFYIGIDPGRDRLLSGIRQRLETRLEHGMIEEVKRLLEEGLPEDRLIGLGLEYRFITMHLLGKITYEEMTEQLFTAIRQFAKRQMTWFRRMEKQGIKIHWLREPVADEGLLNLIRAKLGQ